MSGGVCGRESASDVIDSSIVGMTMRLYLEERVCEHNNALTGPLTSCSCDLSSGHDYDFPDRQQ